MDAVTVLCLLIVDLLACAFGLGYAWGRFDRHPDPIRPPRRRLVGGIRRGDVVVLNSGGPPMLVFGSAGKQVRCYWIAGGKEATDLFLPVCLTVLARGHIDPR